MLKKIVILFILVLTTSLFARDTELFLSVEEAVNSSLGKRKLTDMPFYFEGQKHPAVLKEIGEWKSNKKSRGAFRSDNVSCQTAFLSCMISLQARAQREGGDAIINIRSITRDKETSSATEYRCVAGGTIVHVALIGTVVKFKK